MLPIHDPVLIFALVMTLVLVAPLLFERLQVPGIIGLIVAGILVGPHALGILERDATMELLGTVGLLYIMFVAGLEIDLNQFARQRSHSLVFGALTFLIPLGIGTLMGRLALAMALPTAVLLASMFSSHTLVTYPIASRLGLSKVRAVTTAIGGTIITDTAALLVLAVIAGMTRGTVDAGFWIRMLSLMTVYVVGVFLLLPRVGRWFFRHLDPDGVTEYIFVLAAVFICAWLAHVAGLEPIIGAFLAGLVLNRLIPERSTLMNRIQFIGNALFIPFFLITVGMLVNLRLLLSGLEVWKVSVAMLICALLTKWLAAAAARIVLRYDRAEGHLIFGLSVNQAAATLAAVLVGHDLGLFNDAVLTGTIFMILGTCFVGPWVTAMAARRVALMTAQKPYNPADAPQRIMVPLVNPEAASGLMNLACLLRTPNSVEPVYPLTVIMEGDGTETEARVAAGEKLLGHALMQAIAVDVPATAVTRVDAHVPSAVLRAMRDYRISTVIAGWDGRSTSSQRIFGRVLDAIIEQSRQMIMVARIEAPLNTTRRVMLVLPPLAERHVGLELGVHAVKVLAQQLGARLGVAATPVTLAKVMPMIDAMQPRPACESLPVQPWNSMAAFLARQIQDGDLTILMGARKGRLTWQPALDRLPAQFMRALPKRDFITLYLPEFRPDEEYGLPGPVVEAGLAKLLPPERVRLDLDGCSFEDAVDGLLQGCFDLTREVMKRLTLRLITIGREEPVELAPGAVLVHAHTADVAVPAICLGVNRAGFDLPQLTQPPCILFLLISPSDQSPERHLQMLAMIARWARRPDAVATICRATTYADLPSLPLPEHATTS